MARKKERGLKILKNSLHEFYDYLEIKPSKSEIYFDDSYTINYGSVNRLLIKTIKTCAQEWGLLLDPVYTGKAFMGFLDYMKKGKIALGSKVVFWNTGGLLNLVSSKYY